MSMNPIKQERIKEGLTQDEFARFCGIGVNALVKYEQGLFQKVSPKILWQLGIGGHRGQTEQDVSRRYTEWQHEHRASNKWRFRHVAPSTLDQQSKPDANPIITLLAVAECPSVYTLATWLCIHQDVLARYAGCRKKTSPGSGCRKMPPLVRNALNEVIPASTIDHIELLMRGYDE